jgi:hypothetical protein
VITEAQNGDRKSDDSMPYTHMLRTDHVELRYQLITSIVYASVHISSASSSMARAVRPSAVHSIGIKAGSQVSTTSTIDTLKLIKLMIP